VAWSNRTKAGVILAFAVFAGLTSTSFAFLFLALAAFLVAWGQEPRRTEEFVGRLPYGDHIRKAMDRLDLAILPRGH